MVASTVVFGGLSVFFVLTALLPGAFSKPPARDFVDWRPTRSREPEAQSEFDDAEIRRWRGS